MMNRSLRGYKYITSRRKYKIYRRIVDGKGRWRAEDTRNGHVFNITYDQALGYEGIDNAEKLSIEIGNMLFNRSQYAIR